MASMNISIPDPMRDWVQDQVESGDYASASDYVRDLIRRDQTARTEQTQFLRQMDDAIAASLADEAAGRVSDADEVFDQLEAHLTQLVRQRSA